MHSKTVCYNHGAFPLSDMVPPNFSIVTHRHMSRVSRSLIIAAAAIMVLTLAFTGPALAQDAPSEVTADEVNLVARELWCPLCSGVRLDACELKACDQMKDVIAIKLAEGEDTESIKAYFVDQYGPQVLGEPPREGFNWLAWILPVLAFAIGGVFVWRQMRRMMRSPADQDVGAGSETTASKKAAEPQDDYERKLDEELGPLWLMSTNWRRKRTTTALHIRSPTGPMRRQRIPKPAQFFLADRRL